MPMALEAPNIALMQVTSGTCVLRFAIQGDNGEGKDTDEFVSAPQYRHSHERFGRKPRE